MIAGVAQTIENCLIKTALNAGDYLSRFDQNPVTAPFRVPERKTAAQTKSKKHGGKTQKATLRGKFGLLKLFKYVSKNTDLLWRALLAGRLTHGRMFIILTE